MTTVEPEVEDAGTARDSAAKSPRPVHPHTPDGVPGTVYRPSNPSAPELSLSSRIEQAVHRRIQLVFGSALVTLLAMSVLSYRSMRDAAASDLWVQHTHQVLGGLQSLLLAVEDMQSNYRGFALTGDESRAAAFDASFGRAGQCQASIIVLTTDNDAQQRQLPELSALLLREGQFGERVIALRRARGAEASAKEARAGEGRRIEDRLREIVANLQNEELRLLAQRNDEARHRRSLTRTGLFTGTLLGLSISVMAAWSVHRASVKRSFAEEALRFSEAKFRGLLETAPDAVVVIHPDGAIMLLNAEAERQFGYDREELIGQPVAMIIPEGLTSDDGNTRLEKRGERRDGTCFPIEIMLRPLDSTEGPRVTATIRDITARHQAEKRLARAVQELERSNIELQRFAYVASHDLQEPLRMVASYTELLGRRYRGRLDEDADIFIGFAVDGCRRMKGLIQDLMTYSRADAGGSLSHANALEPALRTALKNLRKAVEESGAVITSDPLPVISGDEPQLARVFQNLVENAIKYRGDEPPEIHIGVARRDQEWAVSIRDNGIGIDPEHFDKIFQIFQRLHRQGTYPGTGIGLAICRRLVEQMGGRIWVESEQGQGSTFFFTLPAASPSKN